VHFGRYRIHPHIFFETLAYFIAFRAYLSLRRCFGDPLSTPIRWAVIAAAVAGAALGSKLLFWFEDPELTRRNFHNLAYLMGGKTIVGALVFGLISVELIKRYIGVRRSTGDLYAIPLALGIAIGRIGCFLTGLSDNTYGTSTTLPWAIDFGDGIPRHPTQLYEIIFLLLLIPILYLILKRSTAATGAPHVQEVGTRPLPNDQPLITPFVAGDAFRFFMVAYLSFRLVCDFIKPYPRILFGLGGIQWACLLILLYYSPDIARWLRLQKERR
jgi:phosphatidylglycerol---prolipoprotein diacylglyceryl transferase